MFVSNIYSIFIAFHNINTDKIKSIKVSRSFYAVYLNMNLYVIIINTQKPPKGRKT
jgi:hypothetical protein